MGAFIDSGLVFPTVTHAAYVYLLASTMPVDSNPSTLIPSANNLKLR